MQTISKRACIRKLLDGLNLAQLNVPLNLCYTNEMVTPLFTCYKSSPCFVFYYIF